MGGELRGAPYRLDGGDELLEAREALFGSLGQRLEANGLECRWDGGVELGGGTWPSLGDAVEDLLGVHAGEGPPATELLVEHHPGRVEVRPVVHLPAGDHLR